MNKANNVVNGRSDSAQELVPQMHSRTEKPERASRVRLRIVKVAASTGRRVVFDKEVKTFGVFVSYVRHNVVSVTVVRTKPDGSNMRSFTTCVDSVIVGAKLTELTIYHE